MGLRNWIYKKTGIELKKINLPFELIELASKKKNLDTKSKLYAISLGSSHGAFSFKPDIIDPFTFNLCSTSQDLYYSLQLYNKITETHKELKKIILFFSIFSFGFDLGKTSDKKICAYFKKFFDIDLRYPDDEIQRIINRKVRVKNKELFKTDNGFTYPERFFPSDHPAEQRANIHLRESRRKVNQLDSLMKLISNCEKNNQQLIIVLPPVRDDFKLLIPHNVFDKIYEIRNTHNFCLIDLFNSELFCKSDFGDFDHVNIKGAIKLTKIVKENIT